MSKVMKNLKLLLLVFMLVQSVMAGNSLLDEANKAFDSKNFKKALELYQNILQKDKSNKSVTMWAAMAAKQTGDKSKQLKLLRSLVALDKQGLKAQKLLIIALAENNQTKEKQKEVERLIKLWKTKSKDIKEKERYFIDDVFHVGEYRIITFHYYELKGDMAKRYHFIAQKSKKSKPVTVSLGSYQSLTTMEREMGTIGKNDRVWHLDGYTGTQHFTFAFFDKEPSYSDTKKMVIDVFSKKSFGESAVSSSTYRGGVYP